jgi:hypothetical protein
MKFVIEIEMEINEMMNWWKNWKNNVIGNRNWIEIGLFEMSSLQEPFEVLNLHLLK